MIHRVLLKRDSLAAKERPLPEMRRVLVFLP